MTQEERKKFRDRRIAKMQIYYNTHAKWCVDENGKLVFVEDREALLAELQKQKEAEALKDEIREVFQKENHKVQEFKASIAIALIFTAFFTFFWFLLI